MTYEAAEWLQRNICTCGKGNRDYREHENHCPAIDLEHALAEERRATVERIRAAFDSDPHDDNRCHEGLAAILDAEANR